MYHFFSRVLFVIGIVSGIVVAIIVFKLPTGKNVSQNVPKTPSETIKFKNTIYKVWFSKRNLTRKKVDLDDLRYDGHKYFTEAQYLYENVKIVCIIIVRNKKNAEASKNTWAKNCNKVEYIKVVPKDKRKVFDIKRTKGGSLWFLLCKTLLNTSSEFNWALVVNDDTFALMENLRFLVSGLNHTENFYLGHAVTFWTISYNMGQAGYVLSNGSIKALKTKIANPESCKTEVPYLNQEDMSLGKHLVSLNITPADTRDENGLSRFHPHSWQNIFLSNSGRYKLSLYPVVCCSPISITFQATESSKMYMYYYLLYQLQVFHGGVLGNQPAPTPFPDDEVWKDFLRERGINETEISAQGYYKLWEDLVHDPSSFAEELRKQQIDFYVQG